MTTHVVRNKEVKPIPVLMTAHRILFLVLDGIGDRPCPSLGDMTPLQAAETPVLDRLATTGVCGIMDTIAPGIRPGSDTAHLSLLGYDPYTYYTGRGPLEAEGSGIHMEPGMIGFRANYATLDGSGKIVDRRAGRIHDTAVLSNAVEKGVDLSEYGIEVSFRSGAGHRAALAFRGEGLSHCVSSNDPKSEGKAPLEIRPLEEGPGAMKTSRALAEFIRQSGEILSTHPLNLERAAAGEKQANIILVRGAGEMGRLEPFDKRYGMKGAVISAASLITGIGRVVGLDSIPVRGITGSVNTNLDGKVVAATNALETYPFVLMNIKGADESGHDGKPEQKRDFIHHIDTALAGLCDLDDTILVVCGDHSTPCSVKDHSADPVPVLIHGEGVRRDRITRFDEVDCAAGGLSRISGPSLLPIALDLVNRSKKFGA